MNHTNQELAAYTLSRLKDLGVKTLCLCPGARNSPWLHELESMPEFETLYFFDERSAGFFALSRARSSARPVAVLTTSGTAVGELLPAAMEAHYSGASLLLLSADRPKRFRGTGAPQSCEQEHIFGVYADWQLELDRESQLPENFGALVKQGVGHLNVCFEEPLPSSESNRNTGLGEIPPPVSPDVMEKMAQARFPLVIVGELTPSERTLLLPFLTRLGWPVITEALSHLREEPSLDSLRIRPIKKLWEEAKAASYSIDFILRFGGIPTLRFWRDLEVHPEASKVVVASVGDRPFRGLVRALHVEKSLSSWLQQKMQTFDKPDFQRWQQTQKEQFENLPVYLENFPQSEVGWFRKLSEVIPRGAEIYLGNSLPIREWDLAACTEEKHFTYRANRGLNGIDGQLSSFFGGLKTDRENWCILGDLTTLYDSTAPWILSQLKDDSAWRLVIINNLGGRIFERMFTSPSYRNEHSLHFESWAKQWGLTYQCLTTPLNFPHAQVIEILPDAEQTSHFWKKWEP